VCVCVCCGVTISHPPAESQKPRIGTYISDVDEFGEHADALFECWLPQDA
jgi:hypothetical protein